MSLFRNKHFIAAMIVTPILAITGYYLTDLVVREQPRAAIEGKSYALVAKSNCRYTSGECDLENGEFKAKLVVQSDDEQQILRFNSNHALAGVTIGFLHDGNSISPLRMTAVDTSRQSWSMRLPIAANKNTLMRIALEANGSHYFSETAMVFSEYRTSFTKTF